MLCGSLIKRNLGNHMKKQNKKYQNTESIGEKLKTKGLVFFVSFFSYDLQDMWIVNPKGFGTSFLCWVDFINQKILIKNTVSKLDLLIPQDVYSCKFYLIWTGGISHGSTNMLKTIWMKTFKKVAILNTYPRKIFFIDKTKAFSGCYKL